jgi:hypothetical protein
MKQLFCATLIAIAFKSKASSAIACSKIDLKWIIVRKGSCSLIVLLCIDMLMRASNKGADFVCNVRKVWFWKVRICGSASLISRMAVLQNCQPENKPYFFICYVIQRYWATKVMVLISDGFTVLQKVK